MKKYVISSRNPSEKSYFNTLYDEISWKLIIEYERFIFYEIVFKIDSWTMIFNLKFLIDDWECKIELFLSLYK